MEQPPGGPMELMDRQLQEGQEQGAARIEERRLAQRSLASAAGDAVGRPLGAEPAEASQLASQLTGESIAFRPLLWTKEEATAAGYEILYDDRLKKAPKGAWLPRWNERRAKLFRQLHPAPGAGHPDTRNYYLTWSAGNDPTGASNMINFSNIKEIHITKLSSGYKLKITVILNEQGDIKEYWFKSEGDMDRATQLVGAIAYIVNRFPKINLILDGTNISEMKKAKTRFVVDNLWQQYAVAQGGGRRKKKKTKKRKPRPKKKSKRKTKKRTRKKYRKSINNKYKLAGYNPYPERNDLYPFK